MRSILRAPGVRRYTGHLGANTGETMDSIEVQRNEHGYHVTINDYYGRHTPLQFGLTTDQAAHLRAQLSPKLLRYPPATTPAKARFVTA